MGIEEERMKKQVRKEVETRTSLKRKETKEENTNGGYKLREEELSNKNEDKMGMVRICQHMACYPFFRVWIRT